jgi:hypothetical protein
MKRFLLTGLFVVLVTLSCSQVVSMPQPVPSPAPSAPAPAAPSPQSNSLTPDIISFQATPDTVKAGSNVTLSWQVTNAMTVTIDQGLGTVLSKGTRTVTPKSSVTYTLTASNNSGSSTTRVHVNVSGTVPESTPASFNLPEVVVFSVEPANIVAEQEATLTWEVRNAFDVVIDPGFRIIRAKGSAKVTPVFPTTYKLSATNDRGTILAATTLTVSGTPPVEAPVIKFLTVDRYVIKKGETAVLSWKTTEASSVSIDKGVGTVDGTGTASVSPTETTIYMLTAANPRGAQFQSVAVNVK